MPEPTIDELIAQTEDYYRDPEQYMSRVYLEAIRAVLEQQRHMDAWYRGKENEVLLFRGKVELEAIRAFVERVQLSEMDWQEAILTELAAMEAQ